MRYAVATRFAAAGEGATFWPYREIDFATREEAAAYAASRLAISGEGEKLARGETLRNVNGMDVRIVEILPDES